MKASEILNDSKYKNIAVSISGGADSDIMLDICARVTNKKLHYIFFDTGVEYQATKDHLVYLEEKYGIEIERIRAKMTIPASVKKYGVPFMSKFVSEQIQRLQKNGFDWKNLSFEEHDKRFWMCESALKWFYNEFADGNPRLRYNIGFNKHLREYLIQNPPEFQISNKCCDFAKKDVAKDYIKENGIDLELTGVRRAEGGVRASAYTSCFDDNRDRNVASYRPLFWYKNSDKSDYDQIFDVTHSKCYTDYGMVRTGCAGCPYNKDFMSDLKIMKQHEPGLYKAALRIFGPSYIYTKQYMDFYKTKEEEEKNCQ